MNISLSEFADKINEILPLIQKEFAHRFTKELFRCKITLPQFLILMVVEKEKESTMTSLAKLMNVSTPAMTGIIDRLVRDGYVVRQGDTRDRRIIRIRLTPKGRKVADKIQSQRRQTIINLFEDISESDRRQYLRILSQIRGKLSAKEAAI